MSRVIADTASSARACATMTPLGVRAARARSCARAKCSSMRAQFHSVAPMMFSPKRVSPGRDAGARPLGPTLSRSDGQEGLRARPTLLFPFARVWWVLRWLVRSACRRAPGGDDVNPALGGTMERQTGDGQATRDSLMAEARAGLRQMKALKHERSQTAAGRGMYEMAVSVMSNLEAVIRLLDETAEFPKVPCPFCQRLMAPWASRCGFCWKRIG